MASIITEIKKIPPVTRFLTLSTIGVTLPTILNVYAPYSIALFWSMVYRKWQLWRPYTNFFYGGSGLNFVFDIVFLYRNSDELERGVFGEKSADFAWQLFFANVLSIILSLPLSSVIHARQLRMSLIYLSCIKAPPNSQTSFYGLFTLPTSLWPFLCIAIDLLSGGPQAAAECIVGCAVGHLWNWGVWGGSSSGSRSTAGRGGYTMGFGGSLERYSHAPQWLVTLIQGTTTSTQGRARTVGGAARERPDLSQDGTYTVVTPRTRLGETPRNASAGTSATTTGYSWGAGNRLGS